MKTPHTTAVLGLGHLGSAIATRLTGQDQHVIGWTRSGRPVAGLETTADLKEAVEKADVVLLCLFDGPACRQVLDQIGGSLRTAAVVLNTSTIAPGEAAEFARRFGPDYVHAPVLGSVGAVAAGAVKILAAGDAGAFDKVQPVLEALGDVVRVDDAATSAALKLIANASLAGAVLTLRDALQQAEALGLSREQALDVLELGQLGGLVARKRSFLTEPPTTSPTAGAEFTIGALAKDMAVLAAASGTPLLTAAELADAAAASEADIIVAATAPAVDEAVLEPLHAYISGHATGNPAYFRKAFLPSAHVEGIRGGAFVSWPLEKYCSLFTGEPAEDEATRTRRIDSVRVHGTVASASMTLHHGADTFTDIFLLVRADDGWRIANKAYHRHS
ncbi:3-hydroxyisobutyrate dehydrogenase-like beta-hydroxyacid dehydrogenase [Catenulispora sp. EB89]|uniref:nuclear transport factor 2 family protein n=1 Tax=Catenulispora sp. EB89 TaxID=3156257 RepID=UPI003514C7B5